MLRIACSKNVHVSISSFGTSQKPMEWYIDAFKPHPNAE